MGTVSKYWQNQGKTEADIQPGRVFKTESLYLENTHKLYYMCNECCHGDRCDDPTHRLRENCIACLGTGINLTAKQLNDGFNQPK